MRRAMEDRWYFTKEQISNTPSVRCGYSADRELSCRQQAANFMQDMGQRLQVTQLCINTAIVYMHRFYMFHSYTQFHRTAISAAALFLAAKVEEQPRKLEHVIKVAYMCLHREQSQHLDTKSEQYLELAQDLVVNENVLLQTLGFDVAIDHPHTHVVQCCSLVKASRDLAQTSYFMASNSLHLTTMCLQYRPTLVACFCIHLAMKWSNWQIPESSEGRPWFWYVDQTVTQEALEQLTAEFLVIFEKCPSRLKRKIMAMSTNQNPALMSNYNSSLDDKKHKDVSSSNQPSTSGMGQRPHHVMMDDSKQKNQDPMTLAPRTQHNYKKLIPQHGHHGHGHGHGHRDQKSHGHVQPNAMSVHPKKNVNRPPDCMYPPPIRISDHSRQSKTEQQSQHYKLPQHSSSHGMQQMIDMKQQSQSQSFIPNVHHAPPPPVPHSQKNKYEVPLQQSQQPPLPPPATPPPPPPPPPPVQPPPPLPPLPSSRHQEMTSVGNATGYNNVVKQEVTEQNHRFDNSSMPNATQGVVIKQESNHSIFSKSDMPSSMSALSNRLNVEQNYSNSNRFNVSDNSITNNVSVSSNSNNNLFNIKQEPISSTSLLEQNHHHSHNFHQQHSHHTSSHHRNYENNVNNNCNGGSSVANIGSAGGRNQIKLESDQYQQNAAEQVNHSKYDNLGNANSDFVKRSPTYEHGNHYQQQTGDGRNAVTEPITKKEAKETGLVNNMYEHGGRLSSASTKHQQVQQTNVSKSMTSSSNSVPPTKFVKAPSIFSPEKDPLPPVSQIATAQPAANSSQVNKLKRKRLSSSGSETEVMVPLIKKLQQDEIARYEDPNRSHGTSKLDKIGPNQSVTANSLSNDGSWNIGSGNGSNETVEHDAGRSSSLTSNAAANHTIETVELGATIEIADHFNDKKHKEGRERKKKKKHKEHKEHKDRERHRHKEKHKSKDKHKDLISSIKGSGASDTAISIHYVEPSGGGSVSRSNNSPVSNYSASIERSSLKIKIPKEKLVTVMPSLKVKFSKELLQGTGKSNQDDSSSQGTSSTHQRSVGKVSSSSRHHDSTR